MTGLTRSYRLSMTRFIFYLTCSPTSAGLGLSTACMVGNLFDRTSPVYLLSETEVRIPQLHSYRWER